MHARIDACRDRLDRVRALVHRFKHSVMHAATTGRLTADWREANGQPDLQSVRLGDVAHDFGYGSAAKSSPRGRVPVLRMGNIQGGKLDWTDLVYTSDETEVARYALEPGDVLFNRTNSPELVGKAAVYQGERPAIFAGYLIRVRCSADLLPEYLNYCLGSPAGRDYCRRVKSDGVSQSNINAKKLADFEFLLPSFEEQREIVRRCDRLLEAASAIESRCRVASRTAARGQQAALAKAFRGELVPQDPADEPADVLLERLRQGGANASPPRRRRPRPS
jgi:type I restriction enzyme S subunit